MRRMGLVCLCVLALIATGVTPTHAKTKHKTSFVSHTLSDLKFAANAVSSVADMSADGRYILLNSDAGNLVSPFTDNDATGTDVFLYDTKTKVSTLVSHANGSTKDSANATSSGLSISTDGRFVAFSSRASDLLDGTFVDGNGADFDVFLWDRDTGVTVLVSHSAGQTLQSADDSVSSVQMSDDGSRLAFTSKAATNLVAGFQDHNTTNEDVYAYTRDTGAIELVSQSTTSAVDGGNGKSYQPRISGDGDTIGWRSFATDLISGLQLNSSEDAFIRRLDTNVTTLISHEHGNPTHEGLNLAGGSDSGSAVSAISYDGTMIAFGSNASDLLDGSEFFSPPFTNFFDHNGPNYDDYLYDVSVGESVALVSGTTVGTPPTAQYDGADGAVDGASIDASGTHLAFTAVAHNLDFTDGETLSNTKDAYFYDVAKGKLSLVSHAIDDKATTGNFETASALISDTGTSVLFTSKATNLVKSFVAAIPGSRDIFRYTVSTGKITLVSVAASDPHTGVGGFTLITSVAFTSSGTKVAFASTSSDLVKGGTDTNGVGDVFLRT